MYLISKRISILDDLLNRVADKLQLDQTRRDKVEKSYYDICEWLEKDEIFFGNHELNIYAQGSYRIGTTVKPKAKKEYDLDFVLEVDVDYRKYNPLFILKHLERRLKESDNYENKIELKKRCIGINYKDDYHIDIIPAAPKEYFKGIHIKISDRKKIEWLESSPKGYIQWFESNYIKEQLILEKAASIEKLPEKPSYNIIQPLQRVVQLIKRHKDVYFKDLDDDYAPRSIVLTTLSGLFYNGEESENDSLKNILANIFNMIQKTSNPIVIENPANSKEKFSDLWIEKPHLYKYFKSFIKSFHNNWIKLNLVDDITEKHKLLKQMFGEEVSIKVISEQTEYVNRLRKADLLNISSIGTITTSNQQKFTNIKSTKFYGDVH